VADLTLAAKTARGGNDALIANICPTKEHFFTLPPTLEDALIQVKQYYAAKNGI
jgi:hypothetical protein